MKVGLIVELAKWYEEAPEACTNFCASMGIPIELVKEFTNDSVTSERDHEGNQS